MSDPRLRLARFEIDDAKLTRYLLDLAHPDGGPKAARLLRHNFDAMTLKAALLDHGARGALVGTRSTDYGTVFEVAEPTMTPLNRYIDLTSVWKIMPDRPDVAVLVTVIPR